MEKTVLSRQALLTKQNVEVVEVDLGEGQVVYVREMTGQARDNFEGSMLKKVPKENGETDFEYNRENYRSKLAVCTICNADGELILLPEDYPVLAEAMGIKRLDKIIAAANKLNKITEADKKELTKN